MNGSMSQSPQTELPSFYHSLPGAHRRHARPQLLSKVRITYCSNGTTVLPHVGYRVDVSDSGISFVTDIVLDFHRTLLLEYTDSVGKRCSRTARLRYRMNRTYGARFLE